MNFQQLINHFGTQQKIADVIGIKQSSVWLWSVNGIPYPRQFQIQIITGGILQADSNERKSA